MHTYTAESRAGNAASLIVYLLTHNLYSFIYWPYSYVYRYTLIDSYSSCIHLLIIDWLIFFAHLVIDSYSMMHVDQIR